jgi:hypothetical protein
MPFMSWRAAVAGTVLLVGVAGGCAPAPITTAAPVTAPSPPLPDPVTACTSQLTYWAGEQLRGADAGYDYQEMGLTSAQNDALRVIVDRARGEGASTVTRMAHDACVRLPTQPASSPWGR